MELLCTSTSIAKGVELPCAPRPKEDGGALYLHLDLQRVELPCTPLSKEDGAALYLCLDLQGDYLSSPSLDDAPFLPFPEDGDEVGVEDVDLGKSEPLDIDLGT